MPDLKVTRANAASVLINEQFMYVFGGFKVTHGHFEVLEGIEVLDVTKPDAEWTTKLLPLNHSAEKNIGCSCAYEFYPESDPS